MRVPGLDIQSRNTPYRVPQNMAHLIYVDMASLL